MKKPKLKLLDFSAGLAGAHDRGARVRFFCPHPLLFFTREKENRALGVSEIFATRKPCFSDDKILAKTKTLC